MPFLSLTADDYGFDEGIDQGIHDCLRSGGLDNVSISFEANFDHLDAQKLADLRKAAVGIHLYLFPIEYDGTRLQDLLCLFFHSGFSFSSKIQIIAGLDKCLKRFEKARIRPLFLNGHQHVHLLPWWVEQLADWGLRRGIHGFRQPLEVGLTAREGRFHRPELMILEFLGRLARRRTVSKNIFWIPSICRWGRTFELEDICRGIQGSRLPFVEGMVHPGTPTPEFEKKTRWPMEQNKQRLELCRIDRDSLFAHAGIRRMSIGEYLGQKEPRSSSAFKGNNRKVE